MPDRRLTESITNSQLSVVTFNYSKLVYIHVYIFLLDSYSVLTSVSLNLDVIPILTFGLAFYYFHAQFRAERVG